ncbi:MAG: MBL fold metallo-hydrolase [Bacillota bacterium]
MENRHGVMESIEITVLIDDNAGYDSGLLGQHGVAFLLEARTDRGWKTVLFDTGRSAETVLQNMKLLGKDPGKIDMVILSHCHFDHTGGLSGILEAIGRSRIPVIAHPSIYRSNFTVKPALRPVGISPENSREKISKNGGELILTEEPLPLMPGAVTTGEIKEHASFETAPTLSLLTIENGKMVMDFMKDDLSLIFILPRGLAIVTGCSHAGIVSIIKSAVQLTGIDQIAAVIGGFHLIDADENRINRTVEALTDMKIGKIYSGHCTGLKAEAKMLQYLGEGFHKLHSGMKITI